MQNTNRFNVIYSLTGTEEEAMQKAKDICIEQTIEFPYELVTDVYIREQIVGRIESFGRTGSKFTAGISYPDEAAGKSFTQFLNVVFGNTSIKSGIRVEKLEPSPAILDIVSGPGFGVDGIRKLCNVYNRPLLCAALKPMGLSQDKLAGLAYQFAIGNIDIIKDDHGLADQVFAPFEKRVAAVCKAVEKANTETGQKTLYAPNITGDRDETINRARFAKQAGAGSLIVSPGLAGIETMRAIAEDQSIGLPVFYHPAFHGTYVISPDSGISHYAFFGQIMRMCGADVVIFPNFGGRFSFTPEECRSVALGCRDELGTLKPVFPGPGGGMTMGKIPAIKKFYGNDTVLLMGGGLFSSGPDLAENCRRFKKLVSE